MALRNYYDGLTFEGKVIGTLLFPSIMIMYYVLGIRNELR